jgi:hypothetical protein
VRKYIYCADQPAAEKVKKVKEKENDNPLKISFLNSVISELVMLFPDLEMEKILFGIIIYVASICSLLHHQSSLSYEGFTIILSRNSQLYFA